MTEAEWMVCEYADPLLRFIEPKVSNRKLHCFAIGCARRIAPLLPHPASLHGVEVLERFVEGACRAEDIGKLSWDVEEAAFSVQLGQAPWQDAAEQLPDLLLTELVANPSHTIQSARSVLTSAAYFVDRIFSPVPEQRRFRDLPQTPRVSLFQPVTLVHEVFGNPFRPVPFAPEWRTDTAVAIASQMYEARDFSAMPILADALQDAGCDSVEVLDHCRGDGPHVRGCWVVDLLLGKS